MPILEHLRDPAVLAKDPVAVNSHLTYTIYDELALTVSRVTGAGLRAVLTADQIIFRAAGVLGVFLMAFAMGLSRRLALLVAAVYALGASVMGPAVLTVEYEPKPRGSAFGLLLLAIGLLAQKRYLAAGAAGFVAFLYHPPACYPVLLVYPVFARRHGGWNEHLRTVVPVGAAAMLLFALGQLQPGGAEPQQWFARLSPELERLQHFRASYVWVSEWFTNWINHYLCLWAMSLVALWRLRPGVPDGLRVFFYGLPIVGLASIAASYLLYDVLQWTLMAQFQPARALVWVSATAVILAATACVASGRRHRRAESVLWGALAFAIPVQHNIWDLLLPDLADPVIWRRLLLIFALGGLAAVAGWLNDRRPHASGAVVAVAVIASFVAIPRFGEVVTEKNMHHPQLDALSAWALANTPQDSVFLFPDVGQGRQPGIFRANALRAIYTDWKSGGQVNMVDRFAREWWRRYEVTLLQGFKSSDIKRYPSLGIDYVVLQPKNRLSDRRPVFENDRYLVYSLTS